MNFLRASPHLGSRYAAAAVAGLMWTGAFPKFEVAGLAWLAPGLIVAAALSKEGADRWRIGYVAGLAHYLSMLYWLLFIPYRWAGIPLGPALGWIVLSAFLALFTAAWVWLVTTPATQFKPCCWPWPGPEGRGTLGQVALGPGVEPSRGYGSGLPRSWAGRTIWAFAGAASWVAWEMVLARIFGGFPWELLGVSQYRLTPLIQVASVTGVYGVSFLVAWVSLALLSAALMLIRRPTARSVWVGELFLPLMVVAVLFSQGLRVLRTQAPPERTARVTLIQPSIPQTTIWDPASDTNRFRELISYTEQVLTNKSDILIWPESAVPKPVRYDPETFHAISNLAAGHGIWMVIGSDDAEPSRTEREGMDYFNGSFLVSPRGQLVERYLKRNLVIFGEYVPLERWLPFLQWFTPVRGGFTPGSGPVPFRLEDLDLTALVLICFEDIFPHLGRTGIDRNIDFLVNITNDGWFGRSAAPWQHATSALFRAVENRVPLIRCCNNGVSCWIDAHGRLRQVLKDDAGTVYGLGAMTFTLELPARDPARALTYYTRHGDVFGWVCVAMTGLALVLRLVQLGRVRRTAA